MQLSLWKHYIQLSKYSEYTKLLQRQRNMALFPENHPVAIIAEGLIPVLAWFITIWHRQLNVT